MDKNSTTNLKECKNSDIQKKLLPKSYSDSKKYIQGSTLKPTRKTPRKLFSLSENNVEGSEKKLQSSEPTSITSANLFVCSGDSKLELEIARFQRQRKSVKQKFASTDKDERQYKLDIAYNKNLQALFMKSFVRTMKKDISGLHNLMIMHQMDINDNINEKIHVSESVLKELPNFPKMDYFKSTGKTFIEDLKNNEFSNDLHRLSLTYKQLQLPNVHISSTNDFEMLKSVFSKENSFATFGQRFSGLKKYSAIVEFMKSRSVTSQIESNINMFYSRFSPFSLLLKQMCSNNAILQLHTNKCQELQDLTLHQERSSTDSTVRSISSLLKN